MVASRETFPLLAELLAGQQRLDTPVARFSLAFDADAPAAPGARHAALLPLSRPGPGEQYAFEVDLDACTGCKSCVAACHSLNGLDDTETWRDVGLLVSPDAAFPFAQTVTTACHHCAEPACLHGCPVLAYEKDPVTGIVRHLDDQCIGCSYCILKCPYDVPKYSSRLGIVRKCDLCHSRLAAGEAPACAQACPTHAIRVVTVATPPAAHSATPSAKPSTRFVSSPRVLAGPVAALERGDNVAARPATPSLHSSAAAPPAPAFAGFLPAAPDPAYTRPTTRYVSRRGLPPTLVAADAAARRIQPAHWPLVILLTAFPAAVGCSLAAALLAAPAGAPLFTSYAKILPPPPGGSDPGHFTYYLRWIAVALGAIGLAASTLHLGQPRRAWRIFLGWRRSWLSREALLCGGWFALATAALALPGLATAAATTGLAGLACSAMIYVDTRRRFWRAAQTFPRFFGTATLAAGALLAPSIAALLQVGLLAGEGRSLAGGGVSARLQRGPLRTLVALRFGLGLLAAALLALAPGPGALAAVLAGELAGRLLFFRAVDAPKMPGQPTA